MSLYTGEWTGVQTTNPQADLNAIFKEKPYAKVDPALYDRSRIYNELERIWGVQEALTGGVTVDKTATEAQIQQSGMQARTNSRRDVLEDALSELAQYTAEAALQNISDEEAREIAGPNALWLEIKKPDDLAKLVNIEIRAGSSGKPNTTAERQAWAALLPMLQASVQRIGLLRASTPQDMADAEEKLLRMTVERSGDRIDIDSLLPAAGPVVPTVPGAPGAVPGEAAPAVEATADPANAGAPTEPMPTPPEAMA